MKYLFRIAFRNVKVNLKPSMAALLSISAAFMTIVLFDGYIENVSLLYLNSYRYRQMYGDFIVQNPKMRLPEGKADPIGHALTSEQQALINAFLNSNSEKVTASVKNLDMVGTISNGRVSTIFLMRGYQIQEALKIRKKDWAWNALYGSPLHIGEPGPKILLGQTLGHTLGCRPEKKQNVLTATGGFKEGYREFNCDSGDVLLSVTTSTGQMNSLEFKISGLTDGGYKDIDARYVMVPFEDAQTLANTDRVSYYTILLDDAADKTRFKIESLRSCR